MEEVDLCLGSVGRKQARTGVRKAGPWHHRPASGDLNLRAETTSCSQPSPLTCYPGHCFLFSQGCRCQAKKTPRFWLLSRLMTFGSGATGQPRLLDGRRGSRGLLVPLAAPPVALPWAHEALILRSFPTWSRFAKRRAVSVWVPWVPVVVVVSAAQ